MRFGCLVNIVSVKAMLTNLIIQRAGRVTIFVWLSIFGAFGWSQTEDESDRQRRYSDQPTTSQQPSCIDTLEGPPIDPNAVARWFQALAALSNHISSAGWQEGTAQEPTSIANALLKGFIDNMIGSSLRRPVFFDPGKKTVLLKGAPDEQGRAHFQWLRTDDSGTRIIDLPMDANTGAIDANSTLGSDLVSWAFQSVINAADVHVGTIFIDVNSLGLVNYFRKGLEAGDQYLEGLGINILGLIRDEDLFFKLGGDEFLILVTGRTRELLQESMLQIMNRLAYQVPTQIISTRHYREELQSILYDYNQVKVATNIEGVEEDILLRWGYSKTPLRNEISFSQVKKDLLVKITARLKVVLEIVPSVSMGSHIPSIGDTLAHSISEASGQAGRIKANFKSYLASIKKPSEDLVKYGETINSDGDSPLVAILKIGEETRPEDQMGSTEPLPSDPHLVFRVPPVLPPIVSEQD